MYAVLALSVAALFLVVTGALPWRQAGTRWAVHERVLAWLLRAARHGTVIGEAEAERRLLQILRAGMVVSAFLFVVLAVRDGSAITDHPAALAKVTGFALAATAGGALLAAALLALTWAPRATCADLALSRCGFRNLWVTDTPKLASRLSEEFAGAARSTASMAVIDVLGDGLFAPGGNGGDPPLLEAALRARPEVPVYCLLLNPQSERVDPDRRCITVFQNVLGELDLSAPRYLKQLRRTLAAIALLNEERPEGAKIEVRYYSEKPCVRAVIFDEAVFVSPWVPRGPGAGAVWLEIARDASHPGFYESYRREFARLWQGAVALLGSAAVACMPAELEDVAG